MSVVGTIKSVTKLATNLTIVLADSTGEVDVRQWLDNDDLNADKFRAGQRVRVIGTSMDEFSSEQAYINLIFGTHRTLARVPREEICARLQDSTCRGSC